MAASLKFLRLLLCMGVFFVGSLAFATENFQVPVSNLRVYSGPSRSSPILATLQKGQTVLAGANPAGGLKKVLVTDSSGHKKIGYVFLADLRGRGPRIRAQGNNDYQRNSFSSYRNNRRKRFGFGLIPGLNYMSESSRNITDSSGNTYVGSGLSGTNFEFGIMGYMNVSPKFSLEGYLSYKPTTLAANLSAQNGTISYPVTFVQTFYAIGATGRFYLRPGGSFWYGPGLEFDYGSNSTLQSSLFQSITVSTNLFFYLYACVGYDISLGRSFFATPEIKLGAIINTSPVIMEGDALFELGYKF